MAFQTRRQRGLLILGVAAILCWILYKWTAPYELRRKRPDLKYILVWREFFTYPNLGYGDGEGQDAFQRARCRVDTCYLTQSRSLMPPEDFDAVVFHGFYFYLLSLPFLNVGKFPAVRRPEQRYVFFLMEPPKNTGSKFRGMENVFNWTMTYRLDSDVHNPYGKVIAKSGNPRAGSGEWARPPDPPLVPRTSLSEASGPRPRPRKPLAAWLVSHCSTDSRREAFVAALSAHVGVHVYGKCGRPWSGDTTSFYRMVSEKYMFYLSFENCVCKDYVTEKFFNILSYNVVPVVLGGADYSVHAPPYSYIDVRDFDGPKELADYLIFLSENPKEYAKYFWWKESYEALRKWPESICKLCEMLHESREPKTYADIGAWWHDGSCQDPYTWTSQVT